jgi:hypothetical protein
VVLEAAPATGDGSLNGVERCASAMRATILIDVQTAFPIRTDLEIVTGGMCQEAGTFNVAGTREQWHFVKILRKDPCSATPKELWILDKAVSFARINALGFTYGQGDKLAERSWQLPPDFQGGVYRTNTVLNNFRTFVSGSCISYGDTIPTEQLESVQSTIYFDVENSRFHEAGKTK